jgi:hypothetical protein
MRKSWIVLLSVFFALGCKKELPPLPAESEPVFYTRGVIDGQQIDFSAGDDNFLSKAEQWDLNGVSVLSGELVNLQNRFRLDYFSGDVLSADVNTVVNSSVLNCAQFITEGFGFLSWDVLGESYGINSLSWMVNGQTYIDSIRFHEPGVFNLKCIASYSNTIELENEVVIGFDSKSLFCLNGYVVGNTVNAYINKNNQGIAFVEWEYAGETFTTLETSVYLPIYITAKKIKAIVHFKNGIVREREVAIGVGGVPIVEDYVYLLENKLNKIDNSIVLTLTLNNEEYSTKYVNQTSSTKIEVLDYDTYTDQSTAKTVLKLKLKIVAQFKKSSTGEIVEGVFDAVVALPL